LPGFRVGVAEGDPGFRINTDGSVGSTLPSASSVAVFGDDPYGNPLQITPPTAFNPLGLFYTAGAGLYPTSYRPYDPAAARQPSRIPCQNSRTQPRRFTAVSAAIRSISSISKARVPTSIRPSAMACRRHTSPMVRGPTVGLAARRRSGPICSNRSAWSPLRSYLRARVPVRRPPQ
jgi:hypothetical protein